MSEDTQVSTPKKSREAATRSPGTGEFLAGCALTFFLAIVGAFLGPLLLFTWINPQAPPGACGLWVIGPLCLYSIVGGFTGCVLGLFLVWRYETYYYPSRRKQNSENN